MTQMKLLLAATLCGTLATSAFAAGSSSEEPPKPTQTSTDCKDGEVWDEESKSCLKSDAAAITDDQRYHAARELAYGGHYDRALLVLASAENQDDPRILNYRGFTARKLGDMNAAMVFYGKALAADPDYILARSYMAQGLLEQGDFAGAYAQLEQIELRGGTGTWAHRALVDAINGLPTNY